MFVYCFFKYSFTLLRKYFLISKDDISGNLWTFAIWLLLMALIVEEIWLYAH